MKSLALLSLAAVASAYPSMGWARIPRNTEVVSRQNNAQCPTRSDHTGAVPFNPKYPYLGSDPRLGNEGTGKGGILVPTPGDTDHEFRAPGPNDIRGPCPGLNAAANHGFLSRDGITTFNELVAAQQNMYNVGHDLAQILATAGVGLDGDLVTTRLSIGCDATERTSLLGVPLARQPGLNGHNKFEADTSLSRSDFFTNNGDNFSFNGTLFRMMSESTKNDFTRVPLAHFRAERWRQSQKENENFFFGPGSLLLYGAASFLYELFPGSNYKPDLTTEMAFFGARPDGNGGYTHIPERIPPGWRNRVAPYTGRGVTQEIVAMYLADPVPFGGNTGPGEFLGFNGNGTLAFDVTDADNVLCLLYQLAVSGVPATVGGTVLQPIEAITFALSKLGPAIENMGCPRLIY